MRSLRAGDSAKKRSCGEERLWRMRMRTRNPKRSDHVPFLGAEKLAQGGQTARGLDFARLKVAAANGRASVRAFVRNAVWLGCDAFAIGISRPPFFSDAQRSNVVAKVSPRTETNTPITACTCTAPRTQRPQTPARHVATSQRTTCECRREDGCSDTKLRTRERNDESNSRYTQLRLHDGALRIPTCIWLAGAADAVRLWRRLLAFLA